jgi:hypothetical protein
MGTVSKLVFNPFDPRISLDLSLRAILQAERGEGAAIYAFV